MKDETSRSDRFLISIFTTSVQLQQGYYKSLLTVSSGGVGLLIVLATQVFPLSNLPVIGLAALAASWAAYGTSIVVSTLTHRRLAEVLLEVAMISDEEDRKSKEGLEKLLTKHDVMDALASWSFVVGVGSTILFVVFAYCG